MRAEAPAEAGRDRRRVLVAEDDFLIGRATTSFLSSVGYAPLGPFATADEAIAALEQTAVVAALLDIHLLTGDCMPIADRLSEKGVPYVFVTGYGNPGRVPERHRHAPRLTKPVDRRALQATLSELLVGGEKGR